MAAVYLFILIALIVDVTVAQNAPEIPDLNNVSLPPGLAGNLDQKAVERVQNQSLTEFKQRCEKNGGPDAFDRVKNSTNVLGQCVTNLVNATQLTQEIEDAKPNGTVDEVFKKYCDKKPQFESCIRNYTETAKACLAVDEQKHMKTIYNVSEQLAEFICFKEGDRIALFIAEGGQECFTDKQEGLKACVNQTGVDQSDLASFDPSALSNFTLSFDEKQCTQLFELQVCVVAVLETCPKPTSANIVESLFKFIRKATPCKNFKMADEKIQRAEPTNDNSGASGVFVTAATVLMAATTAMFV